MSDSGCPTLSSFRPRSKPGMPASTANKVMPLAPLSGLVRAATSTKSALAPLVMKVFEPFKIQSSPSRYRLGLQRSKIRTAGSLGHGERADQLAAAEPWQPALLLFLGAQIDQIWRDAVGVDAHTGGVRERQPGQLFGQDQREAEVIDSGAAVLLGDVQAEEAMFAELQPHLAAEPVVGHVFLVVRSQSPIDEGPAAFRNAS